MKHFLDSGNDELFATIDEPRTNESGHLIETCQDEYIPGIGYSDSVILRHNGNVTQIRMIFLNGLWIGQEVTYYPWNILQGIELYFELIVDYNLDLFTDFHGKQVTIGHHWNGDGNCVVFDDINELINFYRKIQYHENSI